MPKQQPSKEGRNPNLAIVDGEGVTMNLCIRGGQHFECPKVKFNAKGEMHVRRCAGCKIMLNQ